MGRKLKGKMAEGLAVKQLKKLGYKIIETNFTCFIGEIDIIAKEKNTLVFVEVRSRKNTLYGLPQETVNYKKQNKVRKVAQYYLKKNNLYEADCRFDVVAIVFEPELNLEIIKEAF